MTKTPKRPRDPNQLAKIVVDIATGAAQDVPQESDKGPMASIGRLGGLKGGRSRAEVLSKERRQQIAADAAKSRWRKK